MKNQLLFVGLLFICGCCGLNFKYDSTGQDVASIANAEYQGSTAQDLKIGGRKFTFTLFKIGCEDVTEKDN